ncbi:hypothetical protein MTO96_030276 [Rhipicephalus appendiculatus]
MMICKPIREGGSAVRRVWRNSFTCGVVRDGMTHPAAADSAGGVFCRGCPSWAVYLHKRLRESPPPELGRTFSTAGIGEEKSPVSGSHWCRLTTPEKMTNALGVWQRPLGSTRHRCTTRACRLWKFCLELSAVHWIVTVPPEPVQVPQHLDRDASDVEVPNTLLAANEDETEENVDGTSERGLGKKLKKWRKKAEHALGDTAKAIGISKPAKELPEDMSFRIHACAVGYQLTSMVENCDDVELLEALIRKNAQAHRAHPGVTKTHFRIMTKAIMDVLQAKISKLMTHDAVAAWEKLFTFIVTVTAIVFESSEVASNAKKKSEDNVSNTSASSKMLNSQKSSAGSSSLGQRRSSASRSSLNKSRAASITAIVPYRDLSAHSSSAIVKAQKSKTSLIEQLKTKGKKG